MRLLCCAILIAGCTTSVAPVLPKPCTVAGDSIWLDAPATSRGYGLTVSAGGGVAHSIQVDTGSTGVAVRRSTIGSWRSVTNAPSPYIVYNSSGRAMCGEWVATDLRLTGGNGTFVEIPGMQVLAVDRVCAVPIGIVPPDPCSCTTPLVDAGPSMLGIGFDRGAGMGGPAQNPFLNLPGMIANTMQRGYVITTAGIRVGMRAEDVAGFEFVSLTPLAPPEQWQQASGCVSVRYGGTVTPSQPVCGQVLMDTGVDGMYLSYRDRPAFAPPLLPNSMLWSCTAEGCAIGSGMASVQVTWPGIRYSYTPSPVPSGVNWQSSTPVFAATSENPQRSIDVFVNTSRQLLADADYLYDATCGRIGFRKKP